MVHKQVARTARHSDWRVRFFSAAIIATVPYSIARQRTDRNSGVLFFMTDVSLWLCAGPGDDSSRSPKGAHHPTEAGPGQRPKGVSLSLSPPRAIKARSPEGAIPRARNQPLTRPAPAGKSAGRGPPSPLGRGLGQSLLAAGLVPPRRDIRPSGAQSRWPFAYFFLS